MRDVGVVIPAGGSGTRLGGRLPKQFRALDGVPLLVVTAGHFARHPRVGAIVVAAPRAHVERARRLLRAVPAPPALTVVAGGDARQESVWRALQALPATVKLIAVHDAVRPFITRRLVDAVLEAAAATGAAICGRPIAETVKRVRDGEVEMTLDRSCLWAVQTPQAFHATLLREAHDKARRDGVTGTDDAMLLERLGHRVRVVPGLPGNVKITTPDDLRNARAGARR